MCTLKPGSKCSPNTVERKYLFPAIRRDAVLDWLAHVCIADPEHPMDTISTIYFDTPDLLSYREKAAGMFRGSGPRLRWYRDGHAGSDDGKPQCFFDVEVKTGAGHYKRRIPVEIEPSVLSSDPLHSPAIQNLSGLLLELAEFRSVPWVPILLSSYIRYRYFDLASWSRVVVDTDICCQEINEVFFAGNAPASISTGVLEIKGESGKFPASLFPIGDVFESSSFSQYARCLEGCMATTA